MKGDLDSVNGKRFWLVLSALAEMGLEKVSHAGHGSTGIRSRRSLPLRCRVGTVDAGSNLGPVDYLIGGWRVCDTLSEAAEAFVVPFAHLLETANAMDVAAKAVEKAKSMARFPVSCGAKRCT